MPVQRNIQFIKRRVGGGRRRRQPGAVLYAHLILITRKENIHHPRFVRNAMSTKLYRKAGAVSGDVFDRILIQPGHRNCQVHYNDVPVSN